MYKARQGSLSAHALSREHSASSQGFSLDFFLVHARVYVVCVCERERKRERERERERERVCVCACVNVCACRRMHLLQCVYVEKESNDLFQHSGFSLILP